MDIRKKEIDFITGNEVPGAELVSKGMAVSLADPRRFSQRALYWHPSRGMIANWAATPAATLPGTIGIGLRRAWHDPAARLGLLLAGVLLLLVLLVVPWTDTPLLGPHSWRRLFLVRLGLALAAAPVTLVKNGKPAATIVIANEPVAIPVGKPSTVAYAAEEIRLDDLRLE